MAFNETFEKFFEGVLIFISASTSSPISSNGGSSSQTGTAPPPRAIGRAIAGVLSGAAANLRSRFATLGQQQMTSSGAAENTAPSLPTTLPSMMVAPTPTPSNISYQGEQLPSMLPLTVPGATDVLNVNQSFPSGNPNFKSQFCDHFETTCFWSTEQRFDCKW